jgi:pimeloyl-ACP methyl ester carboxylesterase
MSGSMSEVWRRSHGRTSEAPPDERGGNGYVRPTATAPHLDSTQQRATALMFAFMDTLRRTQGAALEALGFGPAERGFRVLVSGRRWRLRDYADPDAEPSLLIVPAPIKRPYIWDLAPSVSAVRYCLHHRLRVYLLEWLPPSHGDGNDGLDEYADQAISEAAARIASEAREAKPFLMGHSLGGTFAAIFGALHPHSVRGLVLLGAPLCFQPGTSRYRDAIVSMAPSTLSGTDIVPGSLLSQLSALASPSTFIWSRLVDAASASPTPRQCTSMLGSSAGRSTRCRYRGSWSIKSFSSSIARTAFAEELCRFEIESSGLAACGFPRSRS